MQAGAKPMLLLYGPESFASTVCDWAYKRCFAALLSPGEFVPETDTVKGCYSNRHISYRPARTGSGAWRGVLVAREPERVMLGWLSLLFGWDVFLGMLLGYPQCCIAAFADRWPRAHEHFQGDVAALLAAASGHDAFVGDYGWETNVYVRYQGIEIIQHFPCRLDCELTVILAHRHYDTLQMIDPNLAERLVLMLAAPVLITDSDGVFSFTGAKVTCTGEDVTLHYNSEAVLATYAAGELYQTLAAHHELTLQRQSRTVIVGSHRTAGRLINFQSYQAEPSRLEAGAYCKEASDEIHLPTTH
jgi:hypothetical protein